jgi:hypothetical protein
MKAKMRTWVRLHTALPSNRKVQSLPAPLFKFWTNCVAFAGRDDEGILPSPKDMAWELHESETRVLRWLSDLIEARLIETDSSVLPHVFRMHDWAEHQFELSSSGERMRRWRDRQRGVTVTQDQEYTERHSDVTVTSHERHGDRHSRASESDLLTTIQVTRNTISTDVDEWFNSVFWPIWPVKENKPPARAAARKVKSNERDAVIEGLRKQCGRIVAMERPIHASTWLNNRRWEDEDIPLFNGTGRKSGRTIDSIAEGLAANRYEP